MSENLCDTRCPLNALKQARFRQTMDSAGVLERIMRTAEGASVGLGQMALAATCPRAHVNAADWSPSEYCMEEVRQNICSIDPANLNDWERGSLDPFLPERPMQAE